MRKLTKTKKKELWQEVQREFPDDETMQQIHYVRLLHYYQTKDLSSRDSIEFFDILEKKTHE